MKKQKKPKIVYKEDTGETIYSMSALYGRTPEEQEEYNKKQKNRVSITGRERRAMIAAAFAVYGPWFLCLLVSFLLTALLLYFFLL